MRRVILIHWNEAEAEERAQSLRKAGFSPLLLTSVGNGLAALKRLVQEPIGAVLIDLSRLPSLGRDVGLGLRSRKSTRQIPIVFVDGDPAKVCRVRSLLPDAVFTSWPDIGAALEIAIKVRPVNPVVQNVMAGYSGTPLPKKLGIKPGSVVALVNAPNGFERMLDRPTDDVVIKDIVIKEDLRGKVAMVILFVPRLADLHDWFPLVARSLNVGGRIWIAWPKQASGVLTDVSQPAVREYALAAGWVDFKVCAINGTWSGLAFARRDAKASRIPR